MKSSASIEDLFSNPFVVLRAWYSSFLQFCTKRKSASFSGFSWRWSNVCVFAFLPEIFVLRNVNFYFPLKTFFRQLQHFRAEDMCFHSCGSGQYAVIYTTISQADRNCRKSCSILLWISLTALCSPYKSLLQKLPLLYTITSVRCLRSTLSFGRHFHHQCFHLEHISQYLFNRRRFNYFLIFISDFFCYIMPYTFTIKYRYSFSYTAISLPSITRLHNTGIDVIWLQRLTLVSKVPVFPCC